MKDVLINQKALPTEGKGKGQSKNNTLDVKRVSLQKEPG